MPGTSVVCPLNETLRTLSLAARSASDSALRPRPKKETCKFRPFHFSRASTLSRMSWPLSSRYRRESQTIISRVRPGERAVGRHEVRVPDNRWICQVRSNLVFGQPAVVLRNEKALDGSFEDITSVLTRLVWWPKMIGGLLAYQRVGYPELSAQVA